MRHPLKPPSSFQKSLKKGFAAVSSSFLAFLKIFPSPKMLLAVFFFMLKVSRIVNYAIFVVDYPCFSP